jgi:hypothetical protein
VEFLYHNRASYLALSRSAGMTVISPLPRAEAADRIMAKVAEKLLPQFAQKVVPAAPAANHAQGNHSDV